MKEPKPIPGLTPQLHQAVCDIYMETIRSGAAPTRKYIIQQLRKTHPELIHPKVELPVALLMNNLVDRGILKRVDGKFYVPADRYQ